MAQSYLVQNKSGYYFRIVVPPSVRILVGLREIKRSLQTGVLSVAKDRARIIAGKVRQLFRWLNDKIVGGVEMELDREKVNQIINQYIRDGLEVIEESILLNGKISDERIQQGPEDLWTVKSLHQDDLIAVDLKQAYRQADEILTEMGIEIDREHIDYKRLCHNILKARVGLSDVEIARRFGDFQTGFDYEKFGIPCDETKDAAQQIPQIPIVSQSEEPAVTSISLSELIEKHRQEHIRANAWSTSTQNDYKSIGKVLVQMLGDVPVHTLGFEEFRLYKEALQGMPPRFVSMPQYEGMDAKDVIALNIPSDKTISSKSISKNFAYVKSLFSWAKNNRYISENATDCLMIKEKKTSKEARDSFDSTDLNALLPNLLTGTSHPYQFWIPILGIFTGCRREELCQLHLLDLKQSESGVWYLDINEDTEDKHLKNIASKRVIPLHPFLVDDLKFPEFIQTIDHERMFPQLKKINDRYGHYFGKWFNGFIDKINLKTNAKNFHSFRHGFITNLTKKSVSEVLVKSLAGHSQDSITHQVYFKGYSIEQLYHDGILKLDYGIDLEVLKDAKWIVCSVDDQSQVGEVRP